MSDCEAWMDNDGAAGGVAVGEGTGEREEGAAGETAAEAMGDDGWEEAAADVTGTSVSPFPACRVSTERVGTRYGGRRGGGGSSDWKRRSDALAAPEW